MRKRPSQLKLQQIGDLLQKILRKHHIDIHRQDKGLNVMWSKAAGDIIAAQTRPEKLVRDTLTVKVKSTVWLHQLQFLKQEILHKINSNRQENPVKQIRFVLDTNPSQGKAGESFDYTSHPLRSVDKRYIEKSTADVADAELKELLQRVMTKDIIRRRLLEKKDGR
jgi:hypothetical protein